MWLDEIRLLSARALFSGLVGLNSMLNVELS